jgi:hypothetical protein
LKSEIRNPKLKIRKWRVEKRAGGAEGAGVRVSRFLQ